METHKGDLDCDLLSPEVTPVPASVHWNNYNYKKVCNLWEKMTPKMNMPLLSHQFSGMGETNESERQKRCKREV